MPANVSSNRPRTSRSVADLEAASASKKIAGIRTLGRDRKTRRSSVFDGNKSQRALWVSGRTVPPGAMLRARSPSADLLQLALEHRDVLILLGRELLAQVLFETRGQAACEPLEMIARPALHLESGLVQVSD